MPDLSGNCFLNGEMRSISIHNVPRRGTSSQARRAGITLSDRELLVQANAWEVRRGGFSGRAARQFVDYLAAQPDS